MAARTFAGESATYRTAGLLDEAIGAIGDVDDHDRAVIEAIEEFSIECSIIKVLGSEVLDFATDECVQIFGGYGYSREFPVEKIYRDVRVAQIYEGTSDVQRMIISRELGRTR